MSNRYQPQSVGPKGILISTPSMGILLAEKAGAPSNAIAGYAPGCILLDRTNADVYQNKGSKTSATWVKIPLDASGNLAVAGNETVAGTLAVTGVTTLSGNTLATVPGAGITDGVGTIAKSSKEVLGQIKKVTLLLDLTGLGSSTTDLDIIGSGLSPAYLMQVLAADLGTVLTVQMTCLEAPATGVTDIDLYSAAEATGVFDGGIAALTETALITSGAAWTNGRQLGATTVPAANEYLYLTCGAAGTVGTYTAGKFLIELTGY